MMPQSFSGINLLVMYTLFVNEKPLILTDKLDRETDFRFFLLESVDIEVLIGQFFANKIQKAYLYHPDTKEMLQVLKRRISYQKAGGGVVFHSDGSLLMIYRDGKWDLPKGGIEKNESIEQTALREVEEETGVGGLVLGPKLQKTYHIFKRNGRYKLKITHWFEMHTDYRGPFQNQIEEGITEVRWVPPHQWAEALQQSYENIKLLMAPRMAPAAPL